MPHHSIKNSHKKIKDFILLYMYIQEGLKQYGVNLCTHLIVVFFFSPPLYYNDSFTKYQYNVNTILGVIHYEGSFVSSDQPKQLWLVNELEILQPDNNFRPLALIVTS